MLFKNKLALNITSLHLIFSKMHFTNMFIFLNSCLLFKTDLSRKVFIGNTQGNVQLLEKLFFFFPLENLQVVTHFGNFKFMHGFWLSKGTGRKQSLWSCTDQIEKKKNSFGEDLQSSKTFPILHLSKKRLTILKSKMKHDYDSDNINFFSACLKLQNRHNF